MVVREVLEINLTLGYPA